MMADLKASYQICMVVFGWIINALMRSLCSVAIHVAVINIASVATKAQQCVLCIVRHIRHCQQYETHLGLHATMFLSDLSQIWSFHTAFCTAPLPQYQFHENPSCGSRVDTCGQHDEANGAFRDLSEAA